MYLLTIKGGDKNGDINTNVAAIERTYKDNEGKLLQKYNDLLEQANTEIKNANTAVEELKKYQMK